MADTEQIARQLLSDLKRDFGLTDAQAAGVVGNLMHESGSFQLMQEINPTVKGSKGGYGYGQWTGQRRKNFEDYAEKRGLSPTSYEANYGFMKHEIETDRYERRQFNKVKSAETAEEAARIVSKEYLRPAKPAMSSRLDYTRQASEMGTALDAIENLAPAETTNLPALRSAYADSLPPLPQARPIPAVPKRSTTDDIVFNSTQPGNADPALQTALNARVGIKAPDPSGPDEMLLARTGVGGSRIAQPLPSVSASDKARGNTPSKFSPMPAGLPQVLPGVDSWDGFYGSLGLAKEQPKAASVPKVPSTSDMARGKTPTPLPARTAGVSDIGYPYGFGAIDATLNPRPTTKVGATKAPVIASFQPVAPTPAAIPQSTIERGPARLPTPERLAPTVLPDTPLTNGGIPRQQVANIGVGLGNNVDGLGRRVPVPAAANTPQVPLPRARPEALSVPASLSAPTNLGPVRNPIGIPNPIPRDINTAAGAPTPMPRIERGGIFGKPQIAGVDIPLPGILGVIQNATKAMNNASGPFNNGADNALMQQMRGGNFVAPGAATRQGTNGFLYAPKQGGGWVNVGRAPGGVPSTFSAGNPNAYDRMKSNGLSGDSSTKSISG